MERCIQLFANLCVWCLFGILSIVVGVPFLTTYYCHDTEGLQAVSGFHGPGAFIAWCITAISTIVTTHLRQKDTEDPNADDTSQRASGYDVGVLTTISYPLIASVDVFRLLVGDENPSQRRAALVVTQAAQPICLMGIVASLSVESSSRHLRIFTWASGLLASCLAMGFGVPRELGPWYQEDRSDARNVLVNLQGWFITYGLGLAAASTISKLVDEHKGASSVSKLLAGALVPVLLLISLNYPLSTSTGNDYGASCQHQLRWAVPRSSASIGDLDQAAALGVALVCSAALPTIFDAYARLREAAESDGYTSVIAHTGEKLVHGLGNVRRKLGDHLAGIKMRRG